VTRLWDAQLRTRWISFCALSVLAVGPSLFSGHQRLCPQEKWPGCEAYCSRLRVSGAVLTHTPCTFMACTEIVLTWPLYPGICQKLFQLRPWLLPSRSLAGFYLPCTTWQ
jgi:hypothetical protein